MKLAQLVLLPALTLVVVCGCETASDSGDKKAEKPAKVAQPGNEQSLNTITLTEKAEERLGIRTVEVTLADAERKRTVGGEAVIPPGQTITVSAPVAGTLMAPDAASFPVPGSKLVMGQPVFRFKPFLTPERDVLTPAERISVAQTRANVATAQMEAQRQVQAAGINVEVAGIALDRAVQLWKNKAGSRRSVDEAEANLKLAREALITAQARSKFLSGIRLEEEAGELATRTIQSPVSGVLQRIDAAVGETVVAGEPLFHVVKLDRLWIRVPVYVGHWREIDTEREASIAEYGQPPDAPTRAAKYVAAPPSADAVATTVDLFYELGNEDGRVYPGQKLAVTLSVRGRRKSLVVPWPAILYDVHGGAWVYQQVAPLTYARRRVEVAYVDGGIAVLAAGPAPGTRVVTDGAVELFGTEFGVGK
ncbi:MAG: efflux RND transporter periplasmic adaptor subunit [Planctomycetota bacterium]